MRISTCGGSRRITVISLKGIIVGKKLSAKEVIICGGVLTGLLRMAMVDECFCCLLFSCPG